MPSVEECCEAVCSALVVCGESVGGLLQIRDVALSRSGYLGACIRLT